MSDDTGILLFVRAPVPGAAKTRLIPLLGDEGAADLHRHMTRACLDQATTVADTRVELWCSPDTADSFFDECRRQYRVETHTQQGDDLGERMANAFESAMQRYKRVLLAGTDCPDLTAPVFQSAIQALAGNNTAVIVPALDGGYVLMGLSSFSPVLFENISWGSNRVLQQTRQRLATLSWPWHELPALQDIDTPSDYSGFYGQGGIVAPVRP